MFSFLSPICLTPDNDDLETSLRKHSELFLQAGDYGQLPKAICKAVLQGAIHQIIVQYEGIFIEELLFNESVCQLFFPFFMVNKSKHNVLFVGKDDNLVRQENVCPKNFLMRLSYFIFQRMRYQDKLTFTLSKSLRLIVTFKNDQSLFSYTNI